MSLKEFFSMGGYGAYVWSAYSLVLAVLIINLIAPLRRKRAVIKNIIRMMRQGRTLS